MTCEDVRQAIVDSVSGETSLADRHRAHLETCERCRRAFADYSALWERLDHDPAPTLSAEASRAMLAGLRQAPIVPARPWYRHPRLVAAAALLVAAMSGAVVSRSRVALDLFPVATALSPEERVANLGPDPNAGLYMFLLHRPASLPATNRGPAYQAWADELGRMNLLVESNALQSTWGWMLTRVDSDLDARPLPTPAGDLEGFFVIAASDSSEVLDAARISPHLDYGGAIEVRRLVFP